MTEMIIGAGAAIATTASAFAAFYKIYGQRQSRIIKELSEKINRTSVGSSIVDLRDKTDKIESHLEGLMFDLKADHIWLGLFHNGEYLVGGEHFAKMTSCYELPRGGFKTRDGFLVSTNKEIKGIPLLHLGEWINECLNDNWYLKSIDDVKSPLLREAWSSWGSSQGLNVILYNDIAKKDPLGVIGVNWFDDNPIDLNEYFSVKSNREVVEKVREKSYGLNFAVKYRAK